MKYPSIYEINIRARLRELGADGFDEFPDSELDRLAARGFDWIYLLGVWQTGDAGRDYSLTLFPGVNPGNVCGSMFAVTAYQAHEAFGGTDALVRLLHRMHRRNLKLLVDFVPNHTAVDHSWTHQHPDFYIAGDGTGGFAHGRDPNFPPWPDTLQLNYANPALQDAMIAELTRISTVADGVRCDMAMLLLPDVFKRTWGVDIAPFWPRAIASAKSNAPGFLFVAEVYWDLEWQLQQQGFDYCYDKRLYDRLRAAASGPVRDHLRAPLDYQNKLTRFLENHDEPRAAAVFDDAVHRAAAVITYGSPGMRFFQEGQLGGRKQSLSVHLCRGAAEPANAGLHEFYRALLTALPQGDCQWVEAQPASQPPSHENFIVWSWTHTLVVVNYSSRRSQCNLPVQAAGRYQLTDLLSDAHYEREGSLLYIDLPAWGFNMFRVEGDVRFAV